MTAQAPALSAPLIERERLFGNPERAQGRLSPDGQWVSFLAPSDGVLNIWVAPATDPATARPLTAERTRPIRQHFWAPDSSRVLFINDTGGDEDFRLFGVSPKGGEVRDFTPFPRTTVRLVKTSARVTDRILVGLNNRDPRWHDVHELNLATGALRLIRQADGYAGFVADEELELRLAIRPNAAGGQDYFRIRQGEVEERPFLSHGLEDALTTSPIGFAADGRTLYWIDSRERNTAALVAMDWASGAMRLLHADERADVQSALVHPVTGRVEAVAVNFLRPEWTVLDPAVAGDIARLDAAFPSWSVVSRTRADDRWIVATDPSDAPSSSYIYDRQSGTLTRLFESRPALSGAPLVAMRPLELRSRDGLTLVSYLTLPPGTPERPARPLPFVLLVHGGPWARDAYGFNGLVQFLANRGYGVLQVNFRGSTGFGKGFTSAGDGAWGREMQDDLHDAVRWAVAEGLADPARVAIMGGSYGGYATLAGLAFTPEAFACGVNIVGPSNLETLLATVPPYWESFRRQLVGRLADPETEEGRRWLVERSPLHAAGNIRRPLLIAQGANDPRVRQAESDQIVDAMRERNIPVTYVLFPDEGHGFARPENNIAFMAIAEHFLAACLGGRAEPLGEVLSRSSATVPHGARYAPGLAEALSDQAAGAVTAGSGPATAQPRR